MRIPPLVGLGGIIVAVMAVDFNDSVLTTAVADVAGGFGIGHDTTSWLPTLYVTGQVVGMATAPTLGLIFTLRRFALFTLVLSTVATLLMPFSPGPGTLLTLRLVQGLAGGFTIPLLMTTALRVLDPQIRLWGLAAYALSATVIPNLAVSVAALWVDVIGDWRFVFYGVIPFTTLAAMLIWFGMDQDDPRWDMLRRFDWPGALLVAIGFGSLSVLLEQGDRLDWFNSPTIGVLALAIAIAIPALVWRELVAPQPLFKLQLLLRPNFAYAAIALIVFLVIAQGASQVPVNYLETVHYYRPLQANTLTLTVALSQLLFLPLAALLLDRPAIDSRWVSAIGYLAILAGLFGAAHLEPDWLRGQFYVWQLMQSFGFALVVMPLLMMATNTVKPEEGPFASGMVNAPRAIAEALGVWVTELIERWRGGLHRDRILDTIGHDRLDLIQAAPGGGRLVPGSPAYRGAIAQLGMAVDRQVTTLTTIDTFVILGALVIVLMIVLAVLPQRTYPPRIQLAKH